MEVANPKYPHLPPHREPGEQSQARRGTGGIGAWLCAAVGVFFLGCGVYVYSARNSEAWAGKSIWGIEVFLAACGVVMLALAYWIRARRKPLIASHFAIEVDRQELRRGESVAVTLAIHDASKVTGTLQVGLIAIERYDQEVTTSTRDGAQSTQRQTFENPIYEQWTPADASLPSQPFRIDIPADKYCSYEGECFSLAWRIDAREVREHRRDPHSHVPVWVTP